MDLYTTIEQLKLHSNNHPLVNFVDEGDVYTIMELENRTYPAVIITQNNHLISNRNQFGFYIYYIDRLTSDQSNKLQIQSQSITTLTEILTRLKLNENRDTKVLGMTDAIPFTTFTQKFNDITAGSFCNVSILSQGIGICPIE